MMRIWADFNNQVTLNCAGSKESLESLGPSVRPGMRVLLSDDQVEVEGVLEIDPGCGIWVAVPDWPTTRHL